jgi:hypothetical protein
MKCVCVFLGGVGELTNIEKVNYKSNQQDETM